MIFRDGIVRRVRSERPGFQVIEVEITAAPDTIATDHLAVGDTVAANNYPDLTGVVRLGSRVRIEGSALAKTLGTGGAATVTALLDELPSDSLPAGHIVKARYTPSQVMVSSIDEQDAPDHELLAQATSLEGLGVIAFDLHSQLPAIIAGIRSVRSDARVVYVYTDGGALPVQFSNVAAGLLNADWITEIVSCGQAFGGTMEAASLASALLAAHTLCGADIVIAGQGPGNLGTGTPYGFSGTEVGAILNTTAALSGVPIACMRISDADRRERHWGVSHHSLRAIGNLALARVNIPLPLFDRDTCEEFNIGGGQQPGGHSELIAFEDRIKQQLRDSGIAERHILHRVSTAQWQKDFADIPVGLSTMGRSLSQDPVIFLSAYAAGIFAAEKL